MGTGVNFSIPGLKDTNSALKSLNENLRQFQSTLSSIGSQQTSLNTGINNAMSSIRQQAAITNSALNQGGGGMVPSGGYSVGGLVSGSSSFQQSVSDTMGGSNATAGLGGLAQRIVSLTTLPLSYGYNRIEENRANAPAMAQNLGALSTMTGQTIDKLIADLAQKMPVQGDLGNLLGALNTGAATGYSNLNSPRSGAYFQGLREMQMFTPGVGSAQLATNLSSQLANTGSQQRSMMLTGGAFGSFGAGATPKTLSEWAEGILKYFQGLRPGQMRGSPFSAEELESQMFPGSNMDAWFTVNGIPDYMRQYFWQYALGKTRGNISASQKIVEEIVGNRGNDLAIQRLSTISTTTQREFSLAASPATAVPTNAGGPAGGASLYQAYGAREQTDKLFNSFLGLVDQQLAGLLGTLVSGAGMAMPGGGGPGGSSTTALGGTGIISGIPTPIANILAQILFKDAPSTVGQLVGAIPFLGDPPTRGLPIGDSYGPFGGTGFAGMDLSFASRLQAMMRDNPNIQINSGFRDGGLQSRLHSAGVGMVGPASQSMHTRGLAADLGPEDQMGWIADNAHRYGLENAAHLGEPWHVGMPGTVPSFLGDPPATGSGSPTAGASGSGTAKAKEPGWGQKIGGATGAAAEGAPLLGSALAGANLVFGFDASDAGAAVGEKADNILSGIDEAVKMLSGVITKVADVFQGIGAALTGDFSGLFGSGGVFDVQAMGGKVLGGIFDLIGIPDILNPAKYLSGEVNLSDQKKSIGQIAGLFGDKAKAGKGILAPRLSSSIDFTGSNVSGGVAAIGGLAAGGGAVSPADVNNIFQMFNGGQRPGSSLPINAADEPKVVAALKAAQAAGFSGSTLVTMGAIAGRESSWNPNSRYVASRDDSYGLWQINMLPAAGGPERRQKYGITNDSMLYDPNLNARVAFGISGGGANLSPWGPPPLRGKAAQYVEPVYGIAKKYGMIGDPRKGGMVSAPISNVYAPTNVGGSSMVSAPVTINNSFHIQSTGGEVDGRRVAAVVADKLIDQMNSRTARCL
jgi:hypothetical protein